MSQIEELLTKKNLDEYEVGELGLHFEDKPAEEVIRWALGTFHPRIAISSSFQAEDMVTLHIAWKVNPSVRVFTLDTGRLPQQTFDLIDEVRKKYNLNIEIVFPRADEVEGMVNQYGANLFYEDVKLRLLCCEIRKVRPLNEVLGQLDAWITGLRREQWASRVNIRKIEVDSDHGGIIKVNPLADWTHEEVWDYIKSNDIPYNKLYDMGYTSIGCAPCTRPVKPGEPLRAGRWWWEKEAPKECGMHCSILTGGFEKELHAMLKDEDKKV